MRFLKKEDFSPLLLILFIFFFRFVIIILDAAAGVNPHTGSDSVSFANAAERIAGQLLSGDLTGWVSNISGSTNASWGIILSPFWIFPGPSEVYAASALAVLTAVGIYNVYLIGRFYHSHTAGLLAILPLVFFPNFVAIHGSILRDGMIFFALTTAVRYLAINTYSKQERIAIPLFCIGLANYLRSYTLIITVVATAVGYSLYLSKKSVMIHRLLVISPVVFVSLAFYARDRIENELLSIASVRSYGARGRSAYLGDIVPSSLYEIIAFSWIGFMYFIFAPFPWQISNIPDIFASVEAMISLLSVPFALLGIQYLYSRNKPVTAGVFIGLVVGATLFGLGSANYGTAIRHRQMFLWVIFLFAAIGLADRIVFKMSR